MKDCLMLVIAAVPFLMGQMCGAPGEGEQQQVGLMPGLYTGQNSVAGSMKYFGENAPREEAISGQNNAFSLTVAESGFPCNTSGRELAVGVQDTQALGGTTLTLTVTSISADLGTVAVRYDVQFDFVFADESTMHLTGTANQVLTQSGNAITGTTFMGLGGSYKTWTVTVEMETTGIVSR